MNDKLPQVFMLYELLRFRRKLLQFSKHSAFAGLLRKPLQPHVWLGLTHNMLYELLRFKEMKLSQSHMLYELLRFKEMKLSQSHMLYELLRFLRKLSQFSKHSAFADLLRKPLQPHVWLGLK